MTKKRILAYIIDILIMLIFISIVSLFFDNNIEILNIELNTLNELMMNNEISFSEYFNQYSIIIYDIHTIQVPIYIILAFYIFGYFVMMPYFFDGQTIGKYYLKLKIESHKEELLKLSDLLFRSFIIDGLAFILISLSLLFIVPDTIYFTMISILAIIQVFLVIKTLFVLLYKRDELALHEVISQTKIVEVKK